MFTNILLLFKLCTVSQTKELFASPVNSSMISKSITVDDITDIFGIQAIFNLISSVTGLSKFTVWISILFVLQLWAVLVEAQWPHGWCTRLQIKWSGFEPWPGTLCFGQDT